MTTTQINKTIRFPFWMKISERWNTFFKNSDIMALVIVSALLLMPPLALGASEWPVEMKIVIPMTLLSTVFGLILSRSQFGEFLALIISSIYGFCFVLLLTATTYEGGVDRGARGVLSRVATWLTDVTTDTINPDDMVFTLLVAILFWFLGYNAAWHVFSIDRVWRVILPPGFILITNSLFYDGNANLDVYVIAFLFLSLLLLANSNLNAHEWAWHRNNIPRPNKLRWQFMIMGALLAMLPLIIGISIPSDDLQDQLDEFQEFLQSDPITEISEFWNSMFSPIEAIGPASADYYGGDTLELGGAIKLGEQEVLWVEAPPDRRYYWQSRVFDTYEGGEWRKAARIRLTDYDAPLDITLEPNMARQPVQQEFTIALNSTRIVYAAPHPVQVDLATRSDLFYTAPEGDPNRTMSISVIRPIKLIRRGESYTVTSLLSTADAYQLREAGTNYPEWVNEQYLYVSSTITSRTRDLAQRIVDDAGVITPYDKAKAIESFLRLNITYNESISSPPDGQDPIDWFLFDLREGYCNYFASAMIIMLRSQGIPSRMSAGFAQGTYDAERGAFIVTEQEAHTWVEAYFPGYGWISFEPTAAQEPLDRQGDDDIPDINDINNAGPEMSQPTITPSPIASPTQAMTPTPFATETPLGANTATATSPSDSNAQGTPPPPITLTPTASPTATPVIVPTQPAPIAPEASNPLMLIIPALGMVILGILFIVLLLLIGMFVWWWWEWRGMGGLSPVARAYARLERYLGLIGIRLNRQQSPAERRRHILKNIPKAQRPVSAITQLYEEERYGPGYHDRQQKHINSKYADKSWPRARGTIIKDWLRRFIPWKRGE
jgi:transglutaminase-like putative cysteine protease